ncbi:epimerase [Acrocarpospora catenulata]|uniref:epimerase n=1 Tax=Acrocarpospora catenulata TaxID=2836182 RepID=UPI001BD920F0|nr:epimerase [Acrocarpospora catenulata]
MKVIVFGATGMVGQGVLRECVLDPDVEQVLAIGRTPTGRRHSKLRELHLSDFDHLSDVEAELAGFDACFFCMGVSSAGLTEPEYRRLTFDPALNTARALARQSPDATFVYVSGAGTDSTGRSRMMWARVKGETENALLALDLETYMFRPGFIQPLHGARSKTALYRAVYAVMSPLYPVLRRVFQNGITSTEEVGRAMLRVVRTGAQNRILETGDINAAAR